MREIKMEDKEHNPLKGYKDGEGFYNLPVSCFICHKNLFYYMDLPGNHGKALEEKGYCLKCYPLAVDIYLADKRLRENEQRN